MSVAGVCCCVTVEVNMQILPRQQVNKERAEFASAADSFNSTLNRKQVRKKAGL